MTITSIRQPSSSPSHIADSVTLTPQFLLPPHPLHQAPSHCLILSARSTSPSLLSRTPGSKPLSDFVGSLYYVAPEVIEGSYGFPADVWSAGVVLYVLLAGIPPFWAKTEADVTKAIREGKVGFRGAVWRNVSDAGKDLIRQLLTHNQKKRITARAALGMYLALHT
ncbi:unnamed protein product [Closterium sp. NIES-53]